jgi:dethiobiotin synthetase
MLKSKIYFIAAIGTDSGKTYFVENVCRNLREKKKSVMAIKPIVSGFDDGDKNSDPAKILSALGLEISEKNLDLISPWRFKKAISPHAAGKINFEKVKNFCLEKISFAKKQKQFLFIEAAGGAMSPINDQKTFLDLAAELKIPLLLITENYLGSISHTLCAIEALKSRKIPIEKIIINEHFSGLQKPSGIQAKQLSKAIKNFSGIEVISLQNFLD